MMIRPQGQGQTPIKMTPRNGIVPDFTLFSATFLVLDDLRLADVDDSVPDLHACSCGEEQLRSHQESPWLRSHL